MKQLLAFFVVVAILCSLCVMPCSAAEAYYFYQLESSVYSESFEFPFPDFEVEAAGEFLLPPGRYLVHASIMGTMYHSTDYLIVSYGQLMINDEMYEGCYLSSLVQREDDPTSFVMNGYIVPFPDYGVTILMFDGILIPSNSFVVFERITDFDVAVGSLALLGDLFGRVLDIMVNNPFIAIVLCLSLSGLGVLVLKRVKRTR